MSKKKTTEEFKIELYSLLGNEYTVLGEYINNKEKIKMKHNICGNEIMIAPNKILQGRGCVYCSGKMKKTTDSVQKEISDATNGEYELVGEYVNNQTPIKVKYKKTGEIIENVVLRQFIAGSYRIKDKTEEFKQKVKELVGDEYSILSEYKSSREKIKIKHNKCGNEYWTTPENFLAGKRCKKCSGNPKTTKEFKAEVKSLDNEYEFIDDYKNNRELSKFRHLDHYFKMRPRDFVHGHRCPICSTFKKSSGQKIIREYLEEKEIEYKSEYKHSDCKDKKALPFDFYLPKYELLIEYDGEQHYYPVGFGGDKTILFEIQQNHDKIKNEYCKKNKLKLLRIPFWEKRNIKEILNNSINLEYDELESYRTTIPNYKEFKAL